MSMKSLFLLTFIFSTHLQAQNNCRYQIVEQKGHFYVIQQRTGDLPSDGEIIKTKLETRGIKDIEIGEKSSKDDENKEQTKETKEARIKVRFDSDKREEAEAFLQRRCN
jgi:hypothetical protein